MRISDWSSDVCSSDLSHCALPVSKPRRQGDLEAGAAKFLRRADVQLASVAAHQVLHDRQPAAVALHAPVAAPATLQDVGDPPLGCDRSVVGTGKQHTTQSIQLLLWGPRRSPTTTTCPSD